MSRGKTEVHPTAGESELHEVPDANDPPRALFIMKGRVDVYGDESSIARATATIQRNLKLFTDALDAADLTYDITFEIMKLADQDKPAIALSARNVH